MSFLRCRVRGPVLVAATLSTFAAGCGGGTEAPSASLQPAPTTTEAPTTTTAALTPEQEVEQAYLRSWEVFADATLRLDESRLGDVYADSALDAVVKDVTRLRSAGTPARFEVDHNYRVQLMDERIAVVVDQYVNHSVLLDAASGQPIEADPNKLISEAYTLELRDGSWKVIQISGV